MASKRIDELTARTPLSTDLVPVADPVTGIAGKSTVEQVVFGGQDFPITITPSQDLDEKVTCFMGSSFTNSVYYSSRQKAIRINQNLDFPTTDSRMITLNIFSTTCDASNSAQQIVINAEKLHSTNNSSISMFPNVTTLSAPNLKEAAILFQNMYSLTSVSFPNLEIGYFQINYSLSLTGTIELPKFKTGGFSLANASAVTTVSLPEFVSGNISTAASSSTSIPNLSAIIAPKYKYSSGLNFYNCASYTNFNFPELETISPNTNVSYLASLPVQFNFPKLRIASGIFTQTGSHTALASVNYPSLKYTSSGLATHSSSLTFPLLTQLDFPELIQIGMPIPSNTSGLTKTYTFHAPSSNLTIGGSSPNLTTINIPKAKFITGSPNSFNITAAPNLSVFTINSTPSFVLGNFIITGAALNQASVDGILVALAYLDGVNNAPYPAYSSKTINLSGGTSATPSATGLAAKATLVARGCTVTHN